MMWVIAFMKYCRSVAFFVQMCINHQCRPLSTLGIQTCATDCDNHGVSMLYTTFTIVLSLNFYYKFPISLLKGSLIRSRYCLIYSGFVIEFIKFLFDSILFRSYMMTISNS